MDNEPEKKRKGIGESLGDFVRSSGLMGELRGFTEEALKIGTERLINAMMNPPGHEENGVGVDNAPYSVLGLAPDADDDVVRAAYIALARRWQPRKVEDDDTRMKEINEAHQAIGVLRNWPGG